MHLFDPERDQMLEEAAHQRAAEMALEPSEFAELFDDSEWSVDLMGVSTPGHVALHMVVQYVRLGLAEDASRLADRINVAITEKLLPHARSMIEAESRETKSGF